MSSFLFIVEVSFDHSWDIDVDVHDVSNEHLNDGILVGFEVRGNGSNDLLIIVSSCFVVALLDFRLLGSERLLESSLLYVSELLQVDLGLLLDGLELDGPKQD